LPLSSACNYLHRHS